MVDRDSIIDSMMLKLGPFIDQAAAELRDNREYFNKAAVVVAKVTSRNWDMHENAMSLLTILEIKTLGVLSFMALRQVADSNAAQEAAK